jgi:hypothetical protein
MFVTLCAPPPQATILSLGLDLQDQKEDNNCKKAQVGQPSYDCRPHLLCPKAGTTLKNKLVFGADISKTFAEANAPAQEYFMCINTPSLTSGLQKEVQPFLQPIILKILQHQMGGGQGHPAEAPRKWSKHMDTILCQYGFYPTIPHAPCLHHATIGNNKFIVLGQVDDFAIEPRINVLLHQQMQST